MGGFKEFLESSTIHGLGYISTSKSGFEKLAWTLFVLTGFSLAAYLITSSYMAMQDSPVSTSISTHPTSSLALPQITFCPPKGTNTVLNYDLGKLRNTSLSMAQKNKLKEAVRKLFNTGGPQLDYVHKMEVFTNLDNVRQVYAGFQSYPITEDNNTKIQISSASGKIQTPGFEDKEDKIVNFSGKIGYTLKFPSTNKSLVLELVGDMGQGERLMISGGDLVLT